MSQAEELWYRPSTRGVFRKKLVSEEKITTEAAVIINYEGDPDKLGIYVLPLTRLVT